MADFDTLRYVVDGGLARLTLDRPEAMNGMTNQMVREACDALELAAADPTVRVLVLTGAGSAFCPGADLKHFTGGGSDERLTAREFQVTTLLHEIPAVTVAAINGACAGAGLGWALACDLRFMTARAKLNTAFLDVAVAGDMGIPWSLPRLIGASRARELSQRIVELAQRHRRYGAPMIYLKLRQASLAVNHKRVERLYQLEKLQVRRRRRKKIPLAERQPLIRPGQPNEVWSLDFVFDRVAGGRTIKCLVIVDDATHESVAIVPEYSIGGNHLARILDEICSRRGRPAVIRTDNGPEFIGKAMLTWAYRNKVALKLIERKRHAEAVWSEAV